MMTFFGFRLLKIITEIENHNGEYLTVTAVKFKYQICLGILFGIETNNQNIPNFGNISHSRFNV